MKKPRKDGRFEAKGMDPATGRRKSYYSRVSQEEADRLAAASKGLKQPESDSTFEWYAKFVFGAAIQQRSPNWREQVSWALDKHLVPEIGRIPLTQLDRPRVQALFNKLATKLRSPYSVLSVYKVLAAICNLAEIDGAIPKSPCKKIRLPALHEPDKTALTFEQLSALYHASHDAVRPFVILAGFAGLRLGEACAAMKGAIDANGNLSVHEQVQQHRGIIERTERLKTRQSRRSIPLPAEMVKALMSCRPGLYLCSNSDGGALLPKSVAKELTAACSAAGIERVSPHELRHTFVSLMENDLEAPQRIVETLTGKKKGGPTGAYSKTEASQLLRWMEKYWEKGTAVYQSNVVKMSSA